MVVSASDGKLECSHRLTEKYVRTDVPTPMVLSVLNCKGVIVKAMAQKKEQ